MMNNEIDTNVNFFIDDYLSFAENRTYQCCTNEAFSRLTAHEPYKTYLWLILTYIDFWTLVVIFWSVTYQHWMKFSISNLWQKFGYIINQLSSNIKSQNMAHSALIDAVGVVTGVNPT